MITIIKIKPLMTQEKKNSLRVFSVFAGGLSYGPRSKYLPYGPRQWRSEGGGGGGGGGGELPPGADLRGAPKCLDVCYKQCVPDIISRGKACVNALMFIY